MLALFGNGALELENKLITNNHAPSETIALGEQSFKFDEALGEKN